MENRLQELVRQWLLEKKTQHADIPLDQDLFEGGIIDSMDYLDLITYLETSIGREVDVSIFDDSDLGSISGIAKQVNQQLNAG